MRHAVYRIYDHAGELIYIGASYNPPLRIKYHLATKPWRGEIGRFEVEWFACKASALEAEGAAIRDARPRYNRASGSPARDLSDSGYHGFLSAVRARRRFDGTPYARPRMGPK